MFLYLGNILKATLPQGAPKQDSGFVLGEGRLAEKWRSLLRDLHTSCARRHSHHPCMAPALRRAVQHLSGQPACDTGISTARFAIGLSPQRLRDVLGSLESPAQLRVSCKALDRGVPLPQSVPASSSLPAQCIRLLADSRPG